MAALKDKIKVGLDETRMLVLGTQVLVGFQYTCFFEPHFERADAAARWLWLAALALLLAALALLMAPAAFHQIVAGGRDVPAVHRFVTRMADAALLLIGVAIAIQLGLAWGRAAGPGAGAAVGTIVLLLCASLWYGLGLACRAGGSGAEGSGGHVMSGSPQMDGSLHDRISQVLTECRVVLPGAQALLGFQLTMTALDAFERLPASSKYVHLASLGMVALAVVLLMTPAAFHRIAERGEDTPRMQRLTARVLLSAMAALALGLAGDFHVVVRRVSGSAPAGAAAAAGVVCAFYGLWFGYSLYCKGRIDRPEPPGVNRDRATPPVPVAAPSN